MTSTEESAIIDRIIAGEQALFATLVDAYKRYVFTIALRIIQNKPEAEEAAQDSFIKAYHHLRGFNRQSRFSTWLYRIAFNTAITYKRRRKPAHQNIEHAIISHGQEGQSNLEKSDKKRYLQLAMARLNESDRTALTLFYMEEFSLEEIAEITGMNTNTMKVKIHRARQRVAEELTQILQKEALTL